MKTPENFNHNPNVGLSPMAGGRSMHDSSVLKYDNASMGAVDMTSKSSGKVNPGVLSHIANDIGGHSMAK